MYVASRYTCVRVGISCFDVNRSLHTLRSFSYLQLLIITDTISSLPGNSRRPVLLGAEFANTVILAVTTEQ